MHWRVTLANTLEMFGCYTGHGHTVPEPVRESAAVNLRSTAEQPAINSAVALSASARADPKAAPLL
jgi:hypothetical protein